ncbi:hypothetical protein G9F73_012555 [Clostridium estertheticum]|uniref:hypothetical protein n=1 Tax=Clostridium estertheticum TaxID=238834 RepID=UPI001652718A|nr:hypothetical protein [Clostridium estertheticum]MBZ9608640.1 hypothetical protein [Clostridium estertheticum]
MSFKKEIYTSDLEILVTPANLISFSGTVLAEDITADENGRKYVATGSLIDADGRIVTQIGVAGSETLSTVPVGILYKTVDVTNGDEPCSLIVEGYLRSDRVLNGFATKGITAIKAALPNIRFR